MIKMLKKLIIHYSSLVIALVVSVGSAHSDDVVLQRPSIFSTSTDWESVTGLRYGQFDLSFIRDKSIGNNGMELYFLDGFPCIGQAQTARAWISPSRISGTDEKAKMYISCVQRPTELRFAWREAQRQDSQNRTTGIITCQITGQGRLISIKLNDCVKGKNWDE